MFFFLLFVVIIQTLWAVVVPIVAPSYKWVARCFSFWVCISLWILNSCHCSSFLRVFINHFSNCQCSEKYYSLANCSYYFISSAIQFWKPSNLFQETHSCILYSAPFFLYFACVLFFLISGEDINITGLFDVLLTSLFPWLSTCFSFFCCNEKRR